MSKIQYEVIQGMLPVGRIVRGSPSYLQTTYQGKPVENPKYYFAVAVPKSDPGNTDVLNAIMGVASRGYASNPQVMAEINKGFGGTFAWKVEDGDDPKNATKEGHAGCWIYNFSQTFPVQCADTNMQQIPTEIVKCGYFVAVGYSSSINGYVGAQAGIYLNPRGVVLVASGQEINTGPSIAQMFQGVSFAQRPGMLPIPQQPQGFQQQPPQGFQQQQPQGFQQQQPQGFQQQQQPQGFQQQQPQGFQQQPPQGFQQQQPQGFQQQQPQGFQQQQQPQGFQQQQQPGFTSAQNVAQTSGTLAPGVTPGSPGIAFPGR